MLLSARYVVVAALVLLTWAGCRTEVSPPARHTAQPTLWDIADTTCNIGYTILQLEKWVGLPVQETEFALLDSFITRLQTTIKPQQSYTRQEALMVLGDINKAVHDFRIQQVTYHSALYLCLRYGLFDCDINSILFLSAAQHIGLPIKAVVMPMHMAVVWQDETNLLYYETTQNKLTSAQAYHTKYHLPDSAALQPPKMLFTTLCQRQLIAIALYNIGNTFAEMGYPQNALLYYNHAQQLAPQWFKPAHAQAFAHHTLQQPDSAIWFAHKALRLYPNQPDLTKLLLLNKECQN